MPWLPTGDRGVSRRTLYTQDGFTASMHLERWAAGTQVTLGAGGGLAELFVLSGTLTSPFGGHRAESWIRAPGQRDGVTWSSSEGCTLYRRAT